MNTEQIAKRVRIIQNVYLVYICFGLFAAIYLIIGLSENHAPKEALQVMLSLWVYFFAYYGLKKRKDWAIPVILVISAIMLIGSLFTILSPAQGLTSLLGKGIEVASLLFCAYQINFFRKREVRAVLGSKGVVII